MDNKFLFFDFKRSKVLNLLIILQVALWLFYTSSLVSLIKFDTAYRSRYSKSFNVENSAVMVFYKMIAKSVTNEDKLMNIDKIQQVLSYLKSNNYSYAMIQREENKDIPLEVLGLNSKDLKANFTSTESFYDKLYPIYFNWEMLNNYKKNIIEDINHEQWQEKDNNIPVILGYNFSKRFKVGDNFHYDGKDYSIEGFFKKDILAFDFTSSVDSSFSLNSSLIVPLNEKQFFENFNYEPITIYFDGNKEIELSTLDKNISNISRDITIKGLDKDLNEFLSELSAKRIFETVRIFIISLIATSSIAITILYKIMNDKDRIGILFSLGISKAKIFRIFSLEFLINVFVGILFGSVFYLKNYKKVYAFFINEGLLINLYVSIVILLVIIFCILLIGFRQMNKLTPKEMVGGFKE